MFFADRILPIINDYLGTPKEAYDKYGDSVWKCEHEAYGKVKSCEGEVDFIPFRFQGQYHDVETGLYYNRFRYYAPDEAMYVSQDPIGLEGGDRFYEYVHDSNAWVDVLGLRCSNAEIRLDYNANVNLLESLGDRLLAKGFSEKAVAKYLHQKRRALGVLYKDATPANLLELISYRNVLKYNDRLGPSFESLAKDLEFSSIIKMASKTAGKNASTLFETLQKDLPATGKKSLSAMGFI
ncbi:RHS repeat-associated core domain-containing protein [Cytophagaceae bacterium ABcell3]|nr:RHS repeat-associated core domain-containing protein [Cytophagaceae bacterium ABcell3]